MVIEYSTPHHSFLSDNKNSKNNTNGQIKELFVSFVFESTVFKV